MTPSLAPFDCDRTCPLAEERWCRFRPITDAMGPVRVDSHVAEIDLEVRDLDALAKACRHLGLEFRRGQEAYKWYGTFVGDSPLPSGMRVEDLGKCLHAIRIPGNSSAYEIGVTLKKDGAYGLAWDFYCGGFGLESLVGLGCEKLITEYSLVMAEKAADIQGWLHERTAGGLVVHHPSGGTLTVTADGKLDATGFLGDGCHTAMLELGLPMSGLVAKPENAHVVVQASVLRG